MGTAVEPHRYLEWLGRLALPGILDGRHSFGLTPLASGRTLVQQSETFTGLLIPVAGSLLGRTQAGFVAMNDALAERVTQPSDPAIDVLRAAKCAGADAAPSGPA